MDTRMDPPSDQRDSLEDTGDYAQRWAHHEDNTRELIRRTRDFIVLITKSFTLDWETSAKYDEGLEDEPQFDAASHADLDIAISVAEALPLDGFSDSVKDAYLCMLGQAMVTRFEFQYEATRSMLVRANVYIGERRSELSREWYLVSAMLATVVPTIAGLALVVFRVNITKTIGLDGLYLTLSTCAGSLGALLSIIWRTGRIEFDHFAPRSLHWCEAISRIVAGCVSGLLAGLAVRSHVLTGTWATGDKPLLALLTIAFVAGTGERLASSVIDKVHSGVRDYRDRRSPSTDGTTTNNKTRQP